MEPNVGLHPQTYEWTVRIFNRIKSRLGLKIKFHGSVELLEEGEILVFNHFSRIETFLPHWIIYNETGAFCRSIASESLFKGNELLSNFLWKVGAVPNSHPDLFPILVAEIMQGKKVIIFPEGGMVKDRKVQNEKGKFRVYSRTAKAIRKHHSGAAVLAGAVSTVKQSIRLAERDKNWTKVDAWGKALGVESRGKLLSVAHKNTTILPCNITFFPFHTDSGFFLRQKKLFNKNLSKRALEELIIESNLLLQDTDMDMRPSQPLHTTTYLSWWERKVQKLIARKIHTVEEYYSLERKTNSRLLRMAQNVFKYSAENIRDKYMEEIYRATTVNINHLASIIILKLFNEGGRSITVNEFCSCLYVTIKAVQLYPEAHLHRKLKESAQYLGLLMERKKPFGGHEDLKRFLELAESQGLVKVEDGNVVLQETLRCDFDLDSVRLKNVVIVYANEVAPISVVDDALHYAVGQYNSLTNMERAEFILDDEQRNYDWHYHYYNKRRFDEINASEKATESGRPFLVRGKGKFAKTGVLLIHGFLASPAEVRPVSDELEEIGFTLYAPRIAGHGTSPADLDRTTFEDWSNSISVAYELLSLYVEKVVILGFSVGALLAFYKAAEQPKNLRAVIAVNIAMKIQSKAMIFVPFIHGVSKIAEKIPLLENSLRYKKNIPEHEEINYQSIPVSSLYQILLLIERVLDSLKEVSVSALFLQSSNDPVIEKESVEMAVKGLAQVKSEVIEIESSKHGILYEGSGNTFSEITSYLVHLVETEDESRYK